MVRCKICGAPLNGRVCEYCGTPAERSGWKNWAGGFRSSGRQGNSFGEGSPAGVNASVAVASPKSKWVALVLCLLFGRFGVHRFYVGKVGTGLLYCCTKGLWMVGVVVDAIAIITDNFEDSKGRRLTR